MLGVDGMMGIDGFTAMLTCLSNSAYNPKHLAETYQVSTLLACRPFIDYTSMPSTHLASYRWLRSPWTIP